MNLNDNINTAGITVDTRETLRYLGYKGNDPDEQTLKLIDECTAELEKVCEPKHTYRRFELELKGDGLIKAGPLETVSFSLERNLKDCGEVIFFAATLGSGSDMLMNRYMKLSIAKAAVLQSVAASAIEQYCNKCQREIERDLISEGLYVRPRFSPGYGDMKLTVQGEFLNAVNAAKTVGIHLSDGGIMLPEKSVSALMGLSHVNTRCPKDGCEICMKKDCTYRR